MGFHHPVSLSLPLPLPHSPSTQRRRPSITPISISSCLIGLAALSYLYHHYRVEPAQVRFDDRSDTSDFRHLLSHCAHIQPIAESSFLHRQQSLANALNALNASAYIAEPGASAAYFANISGSSWHLSERPLLLLVVPEGGTGVPSLVDSSSNGNNTAMAVTARISVLTPAFEETRARLLPVPSLSAHGVFYPTWAEDADPYEIAVGALPLPRGDMDTDGSTIFVDGDVRHFIADGLAHAAPRTRVVSAPVEIRQIRERKSREELEILKCANEVTVLAIRAVRDKLHIGIRESEARRLLQRALASAGLRGGDGLVLFGENAALPHGSGTDRALGPSDLILIDSGGSLHGYESDVTRTFYLDESRPTRRHVKLWNLVREAQALAMDAAHAGTVTSAVDKAAREFLKRFGVAQYFTHRLGHGIGLEGHESPYLRGGSDDIIQTGHTFSNEPGVYIEGEVGVRIEDCFYIDEDGKPVYLTIGVGGPPIHPWLV